MVRSLDLLRQRHLAADALKRFSVGKTISTFETSDLRVAVCGHHDDFVHAFVDPGFEEQRHIINDYGFRIFSGRLSCQSGLFAGDAGMDDPLKAAQLGPISKDDCTQGLAIDGAIEGEDGFTECFHDRSPRRFAWPDDVPCQLIGIDDNRTALFEHPGNGAFACGDAASKADQNHGCGA